MKRKEILRLTTSHVQFLFWGNNSDLCEVNRERVGSQFYLEEKKNPREEGGLDFDTVYFLLSGLFWF